jgi:hypothetical protein
MPEHQSHDVVDILRERLGARYHSGMEAGRDEIIRTIGSEMQVSGDEAQAIFQNQLDAGRIRYVPAVERDNDNNRLGPGDSYVDQGAHDRHTDLDAQARHLTINAIPGQGGVSAGTAGLSAGAAAPVAAGGSTTPAPIPAMMPAAAEHPIEDGDIYEGEGGYWDFRGDRAGVVPSSTRKGQVEPSGT